MTPTWLDRQRRKALLGIEDPLREALVRCRRLGRPVLVSRTKLVMTALDEHALFSAAEQRGEPRFLASCPARSVTLLGLGSAHEVVGEGPERFALVQRAVERLLLDADLRVRPEHDWAGPLLVGGCSFAPRPRIGRDPAWELFPDARFTLPELVLYTDYEASRLTWSLWIRPEDHLGQLTRRLKARLEGFLVPPERRATAPVRLLRSPETSSTRDYRKSVGEVVAAIQRGDAQKVVLARLEHARLSGALSTEGVVRHLLEVHPRCLTFALGLADRTFLGATPEQLVQRIGNEVVASAVAGTMPLGESPRQLQNSPKERAEQRLVVDTLETELRKVCRELTVPETPSVFETGTVQHLRTILRGELGRTRHVLELAARLHPTPAVCGTPRERALDLIAKHEPFDRGWYAGLQGWFDAKGQGEFFVALRSGLIGPREVSLFAGSGLVRDSDPDREAAETALKLSSLREALEANCAT